MNIRTQMQAYAKSVRAEVMTPLSPEAMAYVNDIGGTFADFVSDECFVCEILGLPFLMDESAVKTETGYVHEDASAVSVWF